MAHSTKRKTCEEENPEQPQPNSRLPEFVIIGAMRSGTTSLYRNLETHPEVSVSSTKEVHFFDRNFERGIGWYESHFTPDGNHRACGEATPNYMFNPVVAERMWRVIPRAKLIAVLRNPVDRAYSHYWQKRSYGKETLDFEDALAAEPNRILDRHEARALYSYVERGRYLKQLKRFTDYFPKESLGIFLFEDFRDEPVETFRKVCRFIGVSDRYIPESLGRKINSYIEFHSTGLRSLYKRLPEPFERLLGKINTRSASSYPQMDPSTRDALLAAFREENAALSKWAGIDLSAWHD